jgi:feruloyl-CoA synthase
MTLTSRFAAPYRPVHLGPLTPVVQRREDGSILLRSARPLGSYPRCLTDRLAHWAKAAPDRTLLAWRTKDGFAHLTYGEAMTATRSVAQALLDRGISADRPLAILSGNGVEHLLLALAAQHAGVLHAPVSPAYSLLSEDFGTLRQVLKVLRPGLVFAADRRFDRAVAAAVDPEIELVTSGEGAELGGRPATAFAALRETAPRADLDRAHAAIGPETVAKILFTSGSTGLPKGVINTHGMLCANQEMILDAMPFLGEEPPVLVDWLPWHHTFGGNHNIGIILYNGGSLYLDEGRPLPGAFTESVRNLREVGPTVYFNVPRGYEELVRALRQDRSLAARFFGPRLRLLFYAAASLSQPVADELARIAVETCGERLLLVTGLGATETAPMAICRPWPSDLASAIGLPVCGLEAKLVPAGEKLEVRVKGPNVTPGYWRDPARTQAAFDEEGFYRMGDAVLFADPADVSQGLLFDGRLGEDFKLSTGTWVSVGPLRARAVAHFAPCLRDVVVTGHGRDEVGILAVPDVEACRALCEGLPPGAGPGEICAHPAVRAWIATRLGTFAAQARGSSTRIRRAIVLEEPLSLDHGEVTDKGSINQRAVLARRAPLLEDLYAETPRPHVLIGDAS